jgi:ABC-type glycerol-3-phosphate transport system substrate-binding protein
MKKSLPFLCAAAILAISGLAGCAPAGAKDTDQTLEIYAWNGGYGVEWVDAIVDEFKAQAWVQEKYPALEVLTPVTNDVYSFAQSKLSMGTRNTIDVMFTPGARDHFGPGGSLLDLTEVVYNQEVPGENVLYKNKSDQSYNISNRYTDPKDSRKVSYYCTAWAGGMNGIIYNETILNSLGIKVPNTTDELIQACATIMSYKDNKEGKYNKGVCFMQSYDAAYVDALFPQWWAHYDGQQAFTNFYSGIDNNRYSKNIFNQKGREYSLEVIEALMDYDSGYLAPETWRYEYMQAQLLFLQGNGVFHANGDWFDNEMRELASGIKDMDTFKTMKTPILSKLGTKLGITDTELSAIIDYIDGNRSDLINFESTAGYLDEEVIEEITAARGVVHSIGPNHQAVIPAHSTAKDVAVDFLRFMATDVALKAYAEATGGNTLPFDYDIKEKAPELYESFAPVQQSRIDYVSTDRYAINVLPSENGFPLYVYGNVKPFINVNFFETFAKSGNEKNPADFMQETKDYWTDERWSRALRDAGLTL